MSKARLRYPADFRRKIVEPARAGRWIAELAEEFERARSRRFEIGWRVYTAPTQRQMA